MQYGAYGFQSDLQSGLQSGFQSGFQSGCDETVSYNGEQDRTKKTVIGREVHYSDIVALLELITPFLF